MTLTFLKDLSGLSCIELLKLCTYESLEDLVKMQIAIQLSKWMLRFCISNKLPGDVILVFEPHLV